MFRDRIYRRRLSIGTAAVFAVQMLAVVFCFNNQAVAAVTQPAMNSSCPMGMDVPARSSQDKVPCTYCDLPDTGALASSTASLLSVDLPLVAVMPDAWPMLTVSPDARIHHIVQAQAPPNSTALLYQTSLRIRL